MAKTFEELAIKTMEMMKEDDFETSDIQTFSDAIELIDEINKLELKPYLIQWELNMWQPIRAYIEDALELIGYEYIGNMDLNEGYLFDCENEAHEILFRFKDKNCDYTNVLKFDYLQKKETVTSN